MSDHLRLARQRIASTFARRCGAPDPADARAAVLITTWAFAEALVWPIIPDVVLALLLFSNPERWRILLISTIVGSALGGTLAFALAGLYPMEALFALGRLPLVFSSDVIRVQEMISREGSLAYLQQPLSGVPFKVWGISGGAMGLSIVTTAPVFVLARALRMAAVALIAVLIGRTFESAIHRHWRPLLFLYITIFIAGWASTLPIGR